MSDSFSKRLIRLMELARLTVREGADIAGIPASTLQDWRAGRSPTNFAALRKLCNALGTSLSYLLTGEEEGAIPSPALEAVTVEEHVYEVTIKSIGKKKAKT
ncbi:MAG: helix-turn-helix domain-containing protein [Oligoflexales bacterium]